MATSVRAGRRNRRLGWLGTVAAAAILAAATTAALPAMAHAQTATSSFTSTTEASVAAGWIGTCYPYLGYDHAGGWCDGNGPDWTYRAFAYCEGGGTRYGSMLWAGDRRGSFAFCPGHVGAGGVEYFYNYIYQGRAILF